MHAIVCVLFTRVCIIVAGLQDNFAIIAGIIFAVHPIHSEAVSKFSRKKKTKQMSSKYWDSCTHHRIWYGMRCALVSIATDADADADSDSDANANVKASGFGLFVTNDLSSICCGLPMYTAAPIHLRAFNNSFEHPIAFKLCSSMTFHLIQLDPISSVFSSLNSTFFFLGNFFFLP